MGTIEKYRADYVAAATKAGDISRQLGFAGIALIWIFKTSPTGQPTLYNVPLGLYWPTQLIVLSLILDLLQYMYKSVVWSIVADRLQDKELAAIPPPPPGRIYPVSKWLNVPTLVFFWLKLVVMAAAFIWLLSFVANTVVFKG